MRPGRLSSRRCAAWLCVVASIAVVSCEGDSRTTLDVRLILTGSIDQVEVRNVLVDGTPLDLTGEQKLFPVPPRMLVTGEVLTIRFADSAGGKVVTVNAAGLQCGQAVTDAATTLPRTLTTGQSTAVELALAATRTAGCDGGVDGPAGSGGVGGRGGVGGSAGGQGGTVGSGGIAGTGGVGGTTGAGGIGGTVGAGGTSARGGTGGTSGAAGIGGSTGTAGRGGTGGAGAAGASGGGGAGTGGRGGTGGVTGTGGRGGATGGSGGTTKANGLPCVGGTECASGNCVDAVCCDTPAANCAGCRACNLTASPGVCANVPVGTDPHNACPANASNCAAGGCTAGACTPAANTVVCSSACSATNQLATKLCNGVTVGCTNQANTAPCPGNFVCANATACNTTCTSDAACLSTHYCTGGCTAKLGNGQPCTAANQCTAGACGGFHRDADGDGYGVAATTTFCGTAAPPGYVADASDCCDADMNVRPGQTNWFTSGSAACGGTFDYNCANGPELQYGSGLGRCASTGACTVADPTFCQTTTGWFSSAPGCGSPGTFITGCNVAGSECTPNCADPGSCGRGCGAAITAPRTQGCH